MMTVHQLRQLAPMAAVQEISPNSRYIVRLPVNTKANEAEVIFRQLEAAGVNCLLFIGDDIKIYEMGELKPV
jgi:hypothetical protein